MIRRSFAAGLILCASAYAQSVIPNTPGDLKTFAIRGATIHPVTSAPIERGTVVIADGKIALIGGEGAVIPGDAEVIDGTGLHVYPGMIDSFTKIGLTEISSVRGSVDTAEVGDFNANARAAAAINPHSELIPVTRVNGVTTVLSAPEGGIISGQDALINLAGWTPAEMVVKAPVGLHLRFPRLRSGGWSAPQREEAEKEAKKGYERKLEELRSRFRDAQAWEKAVAARRVDSSLPPLEADLGLAAMAEAAAGRIPVIVHADYARDIRAAVAFSREMGLRMILSGGAHVQEVTELLVKERIPVLLGPILALPPREDDPYDLIFSNAAALHAAGIPFAIQSTDSHNSRNLPYHAAACAAFGLPKEEALRAITINPARIFGVDHLIGSLEAGKLANVIVTDGDPLEITTSVLHVFIAGEKMPSDSRHTLLYDKFRARPPVRQP
jgi:imidazolonepropionase-like amidohydrolase